MDELGIERVFMTDIEKLSGVGFVHQMSVSETYKYHTHSFFEFFYVLKGRAIHHINGQKLSLSQGTLVFIRPDDAHQYSFINNFDMELLSLGVCSEHIEAACSYLGIPVAALSSPFMPLQVIFTGSDDWVIARKGKKGESAFDAACAFCRAMCCHPRLPKQYIYGSNNWYYAYGNSSQLQIMKDAALLAELSDGNTVRPFLVIDDGWQISRTGPCNGGPWDKANPKFPDIKKLAEDIKSLKLHPGIWFRPLLTSNRPTDVPCLPHVSGKDGWVLDPSHPDALINIERMTQALVEWGFELLKHDFTTYDIFGRWGFDMGDSLTYDGWHFYNQSKTTAEIITDLYQAIRRGAGDRTLLLGCNTISHLSAGYFELMRTGDDTSGHEWERTRKMGVNTLAFRMPQHQAFYACDADCVGITDQIDWTLNREWLRLLSISGTPLFVSIDPDQTSEEQKNEIRNAFRQAIHTKGCAEPLNWTDTSYPEKWRVGNEIMTFCFSSIPLSDGEISVCQ